jgi:hypothetical protein
MKLQGNEEEMIKINSETSMKLQGNEEEMIKINSDISMKIYNHIQCTGIIQNLIFFIIMQGRALCRRETL